MGCGYTAKETAREAPSLLLFSFNTYIIGRAKWKEHVSGDPRHSGKDIHCRDLCSRATADVQTTASICPGNRRENRRSSRSDHSRFYIPVCSRRRSGWARNPCTARSPPNKRCSHRQEPHRFFHWCSERPSGSEPRQFLLLRDPNSRRDIPTAQRLPRQFF